MPKSLRSKMTIIAVLPVIVSTILIGTIGVHFLSELMTTYSEEVLISMANEQGSTMDRVFENIEHTGNLMVSCVLDEVTSIEKLQEVGFVETYNLHAEELLLNLAANTQYADSLYIRFNPKYTDGLSGIFYIRNDEIEQKNGIWEKAPLTDLSDYENSTSEYLAWWLEPVKSKKATWVMPHVDNVLRVDTISYCIPVYVEEELVCVVGVDTRVSVLAKFLKDVDLYETGSTFLTDENGYVIYYPTDNDPKENAKLKRDRDAIAKTLTDKAEGERITLYTNPEQEHIALADKQLTCGLHLIVSVQQKEIYANRQQMIKQMIFVILLVLAVLLLIVEIFVNRLIAPIHSLIQASEKIAQGDIESVQLADYSKDDEIGLLNESLKGTMAYLKKYINRVNALAYQDLMTGVKNRTCYLEAVASLNAENKLDTLPYSVVVFDVNDLKTVNDTLGHEFGDKIIMEASKLICATFKSSPVYRIGGDEFVVISRGKDFDNCESLVQAFKEQVEKGIYIGMEYQLVVACGMSKYEENDIHFDDVFGRADKAMYENKMKLKKNR